MTQMTDPKIPNTNTLRARVESVLIKYGPMRVDEVATMRGEENERINQAMIRMLSFGKLEYEGKPGQRIYSVRARKVSTVSKTRRPASEDPFLGIDWSTSIQRPGCQDAFECPSRRGDQLVPYRAPILNASSMKNQVKDTNYEITQWR